MFDPECETVWSFETTGNDSPHTAQHPGVFNLMHACTHTHAPSLCFSHTQSLKLTWLRLKLGPLWHTMLKCLDYPWYCISTSYSHSAVNSSLYHSTSLKNLFIIKMLFLWVSILSSSRKWSAVSSHSIHINGPLKCPHYRLREDDWLMGAKEHSAEENT
jgi:hypothetical protein